MEISQVEDKLGPNLNRTFVSEDFTVIIPAYNEEKRITPVLEELCDLIEQHFASWKIIVMIDGDDGTLDIVRDFVDKYSFVKYIKSEGRGGKGGAVKKASSLVDSDFVVLMDADNSVSVREVLDKVHLLKNYDAVILSRYADKENNIPLVRRIISRGFNLALRILLDLRISDTQSGYKLFRTSVFKEAINKVTTTNTFYDVALLYYINEAQYDIIETPTPYKHDSGSTFHPIGEVIGQGASLLAFVVRHTKLFDYIPPMIVDLYYRKFRWL